jgi:hypothetical protein
LEKAAKGYCICFEICKETKNALGKGNTDTDKTTEALTVEELKLAEEIWIKSIQEGL